MRKKIILLLLFSITISFVAFKRASEHNQNLKDNIFSKKTQRGNNFHDTLQHDVKEQVDKYVLENFKAENNKSVISMGITSHHLPNALPLIFSFYQSLANSSGPRESFVVLAPDHLEKCPFKIVTSTKNFITPYGILETDKSLAEYLLHSGLPDGNDCFEGDHSIGAQAIMIKKFFPSAKILPVVFSSSTSDEAINKIIDLLWQKKENIFILASIDFSHHNPYHKAQLIDAKTRAMIENLKTAGLTLENVDSPAALKIILDMAKIRGYKPTIISQSNSYNFSGIDNNTTGYMSVVFHK